MAARRVVAKADNAQHANGGNKVAAVKPATAGAGLRSGLWRTLQRQRGARVKERRHKSRPGLRPGKAWCIRPKGHQAVQVQHGSMGQSRDACRVGAFFNMYKNGGGVGQFVGVVLDVSVVVTRGGGAFLQWLRRVVMLIVMFIVTPEVMWMTVRGVVPMRARPGPLC